MRASSPQDSIFPLLQGDARVCIAVLDGEADLDHPCFDGADVTLLPGPALAGKRPPDALVAHGTHVASVLFGQPGSEVEGLVPNCTGLVIPIYGNEARSVSQLDLARAIELAVERGADLINISGGQLTDAGEADVWLHNAIRHCRDRNVLVIAAAGNDGCDCLHVPAALPDVLAVGALDRNGRPMDFSNWGDAYRSGGLMAPGEKILGAKPGGGTVRSSGTSFATPLVSGAAGLLLSLQVQRRETPDPRKIRRLLLDTALPCEGSDTNDASRCLAGRLNLAGAFDALIGSTEMTQNAMTREAAVSPQCACGEADQPEPKAVPSAGIDSETADPFYSAASMSTVLEPAREPADGGLGLGLAAQPARDGGGGRAALAARPASVAKYGAILPSQSPDEVAAAPGIVFPIGVLGYDFGTEARRDTFKQLMPPIDRVTGLPVSDPDADPLGAYPANPYDARQMVDYLRNFPSEARSLIWTLNIDLTPVYVIEPAGPYAAEVYEELRKLLDGEIRAETDDDYVERISVPGLLTGRTVKLFSGQVVPVIEPQNKRGIFGWHTNALVNKALALAKVAFDSDQANLIRGALSDFLNRVYYDLRNLGKTSQERALNFGVTNAFQAMLAFTDPLVKGMQLDEIRVDKSPFCRMDSDCWDVKLRFFDPDNNTRAKRIIRYTIDVSDLIPVAMGEPRTWTTAN
jgi:cyanobactin maturation PatA/PatG family protease